MIRRYINMLLIVCLAVLACDGDDDGDESQAGNGGGTAGTSSEAAIAGSPCEKICDIVEALKCPNEDGAACMQKCNRYWTYEPCKTELRALLNCGAQFEQSSWECDEIGEADVKGGLCDAEFTAAESCQPRSTLYRRSRYRTERGLFRFRGPDRRRLESKDRAARSRASTAARSRPRGGFRPRLCASIKTLAARSPGSNCTRLRIGRAIYFSERDDTMVRLGRWTQSL